MRHLAVVASGGRRRGAGGERQPPRRLQIRAHHPLRPRPHHRPMYARLARFRRRLRRRCKDRTRMPASLLPSSLVYATFPTCECSPFEALARRAVVSTSAVPVRQLRYSFPSISQEPLRARLWPQAQQPGAPLRKQCTQHLSFPRVDVACAAVRQLLRPVLPNYRCPLPHRPCCSRGVSVCSAGCGKILS